MSPIDESLLLLAEAFERASIQTMVGGSIAAMLYGEARSTIDIDLVIDAGPSDLEAVIGAFVRRFTTECGALDLWEACLAAPGYEDA